MTIWFNLANYFALISTSFPIIGLTYLKQQLLFVISYKQPISLYISTNLMHTYSLNFECFSLKSLSSLIFSRSLFFVLWSIASLIGIIFMKSLFECLMSRFCHNTMLSLTDYYLLLFLAFCLCSLNVLVVFYIILKFFCYFWQLFSAYLLNLYTIFHKAQALS